MTNGPTIVDAIGDIHRPGDPSYAAAASSGGYPNGNPKDAIGSKKPPTVSVIPGTALLHLGHAMANGRDKYGAYNFRTAPVRASIYLDAAKRHIEAWWGSRQELAADSQVHHLGHAMACYAIVLDALEQGTLIDDRPVAGAEAEMLERWARQGHFGKETDTP